MSEPTSTLPTQHGSVIGWSTYYDGNLYGCAVLERDPDDAGDLVWYLAGFSKTKTQAEMAELVRSWQWMGLIAPSRTHPGKPTS